MFAKAFKYVMYNDVNNLLKGLSRSGGATLFGESQSRGTWHPIRVAVQAGNNWKTDPYVAKVEPHWKLWVYDCRLLA